MSSLTGKTTVELEQTVANNGFWPELSVGAFVRNYRLPAEYAVELISNELFFAISHVNTTLKPVADLFASYDDIEQEHYGSGDAAQGDIYMHYVRAVHCFTRAQLGPLFSTLNRKDAADQAHEDWAYNQDHWFTLSAHSISYIQKRLAPTVHDASTDTLQSNGFTVAVL